MTQRLKLYAYPELIYTHSSYPFAFQSLPHYVRPPWPKGLSVGNYSFRHMLLFFSGCIQDSIIRRELIDTRENDEDMDIFSSDPPFPYEEGFRRSKYCRHVKGYEVNTERISDPLHYGCVPVVLSNYHDLPFANVLDWRKFSIIVNHRDIKSLKEVLLSVPGDTYEDMFQNLCQVRRHFVWHETPRDYDAFYMTACQLWLMRGMHSLSR